MKLRLGVSPGMHTGPWTSMQPTTVILPQGRGCTEEELRGHAALANSNQGRARKRAHVRVRAQLCVSSDACALLSVCECARAWLGWLDERLAAYV
eukprot:6183316-Pleurochrysis_carterae.AAC.3